MIAEQPAFVGRVVFSSYVDRRWLGSDELRPDVNPSTTKDVVGRYAVTDAGTLTEAVAAARSASQAWASSSPQLRADILEFVAADLLRQQDQLGVLLAREEGKPLAEALGEVIRAAHIFRYFGGRHCAWAGNGSPPPGRA